MANLEICEDILLTIADSDFHIFKLLYRSIPSLYRRLHDRKYLRKALNKFVMVAMKQSEIKALIGSVDRFIPEGTFFISYLPGGIPHSKDDKPSLIYDNEEFISNMDSTDSEDEDKNTEMVTFTEWHFCGKLHRENNPALKTSEGEIGWYIKGKLHREGDKYALKTGQGTKKWYKEGKLHRENDEPAVITLDGIKKWYKKGKLHRENDEPAVTTSDGCRMWYKEGKLHRENDKAAVIEYKRHRKWYREGKLHRENDKPAIIERNGNKEWWLDGKRYRKELNKK